MAHVFVDEYRLLVFPIVLGSRRRLFPETSDKTVLRLVGTKTPDSGALILTYRPGEKARERMDKVVQRRRVVLPGVMEAQGASSGASTKGRRTTLPIDYRGGKRLVDDGNAVSLCAALTHECGCS